MDFSLKFGDVFSRDEKEYIFLARTDELTYAGLILDKEFTRAVKLRHDSVLKDTSKSERAKCMKIFCYVILKTEEYKERMASFANTDYDDWDFELCDNYICPLNSEDIANIKEEILKEDSAAPLGLKEIVKSFDE